MFNPNPLGRHLARSVLPIVLGCAVSVGASAATTASDYAGWMLKKQDIIGKQIEIQHKLVSSDRFFERVVFPDDNAARGQKLDEYIVYKAFDQNDVPLEKTVRKLSSVSKVNPQGMKRPDTTRCTQPHSPESVISLMPLGDHSPAEIAVINEALDAYLPLYGGLLEALDDSARGNRLEVGQTSRGLGRNGSYGYVQNEIRCLTSGTSKSDFVSAESYFGYLTGLVRARTPWVLDSAIKSRGLGEASLDQLQAMQRIFEFMEEHPDYFREFVGDYKTFAPAIVSALEKKANTEDLSTLLDEPVNESGSAGSGSGEEDLSLDSLSIDDL